MIISASRRTDIPAYYSEWLFQRLREEYVLVRNPMNTHQIGRISLSPDLVDGLVLWTKNPIPMLSRLHELEKYNFYFQFTLTAYGKDVEPNVPFKMDTIIPSFIRLSKAVGRDRVVWRYDPIFFNAAYTLEYHCRYFKEYAAMLSEYTEKCTVSFLDRYRSTARNVQPLQIQAETHDRQLALLGTFSEIAQHCGIFIDTCAEAIELNGLQIPHACCIDRERLERLGHCQLKVGKDKNQRPACGCVESIDIGAYDSCRNGCLYCYANHSGKALQRNCEKHDPKAPLLFGEVGEADTVRDRKVRSLAVCPSPQSLRR